MHSRSNRTCMTQRPTCHVTRNAALCDACLSFVRFTLFYACTTCNRAVHVCLPFINTVAICILIVFHVTKSCTKKLYLQVYHRVSQSITYFYPNLF